MPNLSSLSPAASGMPPRAKPSSAFSAVSASGLRLPVAGKSHMKTTRVRYIAAAARGSTLLLPIAQGNEGLGMSPINLPWASLLCSNPAYPSIDVTEEEILIGRKQPCGLIVNHQAISGIHCRLYRKLEKTDAAAPSADGGAAAAEGVEASSTSLGSVTEAEEEKEEAEQPAAGGVSASASRVSADSVIDDKNKRKSRIKVAEMIEFLHSNSQRPSSPQPGSHHSRTETVGGLGGAAEDAVVWKGSKNAGLTQQRLDSAASRQEIWLEDLSTNGTFLGSDGGAVKIGNGNRVRLRNGQQFTLLTASSAAHERIAYSLRVNGESPVGDSDDDAPTDTVTIVFTDIESSTSLWEACPAGMQAALEEHDRIMRTLLARFRGYEVKTEGDAFMLAFFTVLDAVKWCLAVQEAFLRMKWDDNLLELPSARREYVDAAGQRRLQGSDAQLLFNGLRVRMGLHVGQPSCRRNPTTHRMDYYGKPVNLAARVSDAGHGGQIVCTEEVCAVVQDEVQKEKERAEKEWVEEREEEEEERGQQGGAAGAADEGEEGEEADEDEGGAVIDGAKEEKEGGGSFLDPASIPHHRVIDSLTPPTSARNTGNEETFSALVKHNAERQQQQQSGSTQPLSGPSSSSSSPGCPATPPAAGRAPMDSERYARLKAGVNKKRNTLDSTLEQLTDLHSVTFLDCGAVSLKGITGGTRVYQVSSLSLTNRRWEPALRAKAVKEEGREMVVGEEAPPAPPCAPLTLTLYSKHTIPLQIRRNILRNRKLQRRGSKAEDEQTARTEETDRAAPGTAASAAAATAATASVPSPHAAAAAAVAGTPKSSRNVHFAASLSAAPQQPLDKKEETKDKQSQPQQLQQQQRPVQVAASSSTLASPAPSPKPLAVTNTSAPAAATVAVSEAAAPAPRLQLARVSGSSALAAAILQNKTALAAEKSRTMPQLTTPPPVSSDKPASAAAATSPAPNVAVAAQSPLSAPSASQCEKPVTIRPESSPASSLPPLSASPAHSPPPAQDAAWSASQHHRSSSSNAAEASSARRSSHSSRSLDQSHEADKLAEACYAAFDAEARQHSQPSATAAWQRPQQPPAVSSSSSSASVAAASKSVQRHRNAGLAWPAPRASSYPGSGFGPAASHVSALNGVPFPALPDALYAQQAQIRAQMIAQQQAHAYAMQVLAYQQQQLQQAHYAYVQQQYAAQRQQSVEAAAGGGGQAAAAVLAFPPAQTPSFGLSPSVSPAVPFSYSLSAGSQWSGGPAWL